MKKQSVPQQWAQQTIERRRVADEVRAEKQAAAVAANAADSNKFNALTDEIATLAARLDPENLDSIQLLAAKRDQLARLRIKYEADAKARLDGIEKTVQSDSRLPAVSVDYNFSRLIDDAERELFAAFRPFFQNDAGAQRSANDSPGGCVLRRLQNGNSNATERLEIISAVAAGQNPPWQFQ